MHPYIVSMHADERCGPQDLTPKCRSPTQVASRTAGAHPNRIYAHATSMTMTEHPNTISIIIHQPRPPSQKHCRELDSAPPPRFPSLQECSAARSAFHGLALATEVGELKSSQSAPSALPTCRRMRMPRPPPRYPHTPGPSTRGGKHTHITSCNGVT